MNVFIDTNVLLDVLGKREPFYGDSVAVWTLAYLPTGEIQGSFLAVIGRGLGWVGQLMGLRWEMMVALLTGFVAKENTLATLGVLFGAGAEDQRW